MNKPMMSGAAMPGLAASAIEYMLDIGQRSVLFLDVMRQRGDQYREHIAQTAPNVLNYAAELVMDGRKLEQPVNYALGAHYSAKGCGDRPQSPAVRRRRPPRGSRSGDRRLQGRQRDRRRDEGRSSLLLHRLPAGTYAGANHRKHRAGGSAVHRESDGSASRTPTASLA